MPLGAGNYDAACTAARLATAAETVVLIVNDGNLGDGFSVQSSDPDLPRKLPAILRLLADLIETAEKDRQ